MKYNEMLSIRDECAECPWLDNLARAHDVADDIKTELSIAIMEGKTTEGLTNLLLSEGYSIDEAKAYIAERAEVIIETNIEALEELDEVQGIYINSGRALQDTCRSEGTFIDSDDQTIKMCMSAIAASISASLHD